MQYSDPVADLISSDLDELRRRDTIKNVPGLLIVFVCQVMLWCVYLIEVSFYRWKI